VLFHPLRSIGGSTRHTSRSSFGNRHDAPACADRTGDHPGTLASQPRVPEDPSNLGGHDVPHNFIRISADTPNPGRRKEKDVKAICEKNQGVFGCLLFDDDTNPEFAYVLVKNGKLDEIVAALGGTRIETYFDCDELKK
jgi:hypothetical protein